MPIYTVPPYQNDLRRDAMILDTNVLVAAFCPRDQHHEDARWFIDEWPEPFLVPITVLVETWNMIVGSYKCWSGGIDFLLWLRTPGNAQLLPQDIAPFDGVTRTISTIHVDCVDAFVSSLADGISRQCKFNPYIRVATYDTTDLMKCREEGSLQLMIFDMRSFDVY
jgi:hypothetical protein